MLVSYCWLQEYIHLELSPQELAGRLTMAGLEVESVSAFRDPLPRVVVGKILSLDPHPCSERLTLVRLEAGESRPAVVCGAANLRIGQLVALALPGAILPGGSGPLEAADILGVRSEGMICSAPELGLELCGGKDEILVLEGPASPGESLDRALGLEDQILSIDLTPNRADCLSMLGLAYEVGALTGEQVNLPKTVLEEGVSSIEHRLSVEVGDSRLSPRYTARLVEKVSIGNAPLWMQLRLLKAGVRPISNVVDITNYVMLEYGQPLHAFDFDLLAGDQIIVRRARLGEKLMTLDGVERKLDPEMLVIADAAGPTALAGVMGGESTGIRRESENILIEAALFDRVNVRRTSARLGLSSEASQRFEKGINPGWVVAAQNRAAGLLGELAGGRVLSGIIDICPQPFQPRSIRVRPHRINEILGLKIPPAEIQDVLQRLGFTLAPAPGFSLQVEVPLRRGDVELEEDVVEEVARLYGYDRIPVTLPRGELIECREQPEQLMQDLIKQTLITAGFHEVINYSFINPGYLGQLALPEGDHRFKAVPVQNPLSEEQAVLRTTLLPGLLKNLQHNFYYQVENQQLFEMGAVFYPLSLPVEKTPPRERLTLALAATGHLTEPHWAGQVPPIDFYTLKGILELLSRRLGLEEVEYGPRSLPYLHPTRSAVLISGGLEIGCLGELHPGVAKLWDLPRPVIVCELDLETLIARADPVPRYNALPRYPVSLRDIAVVAPREVPAAELELCIRRAGGELVEEVILFDVYQGGQIPAGERSLAFAIRYRSPERTLTDEQVNTIHRNIISALSRIGARLRE